MALDYIVIQEKCANNPLILEEDESNIYFYNDNIYQLYDGDGKEILFKDKIITENGKNVYIKYVEKTEFTNDIYYAFIPPNISFISVTLDTSQVLKSPIDQFSEDDPAL